MFKLLMALFEKIEQLHSWHIASLKRENELRNRLEDTERLVTRYESENEELRKRCEELETELYESRHD